MQASASGSIGIKGSTVPAVSYTHLKSAKEATNRLLNLKNIPDAIFGINDDMAIGAIEAIKPSFGWLINYSVIDCRLDSHFGRTPASRPCPKWF